ncbi:MAG: ABC transporter substrate-binding protein [Candidatus Rokubacteria bacterium]|nr:ABC transporter substrate-binding protein [Candidatus Rokubacteria bacterium]MBI4592578.1 ABC transporter substrate-binding protein [Candidatus Rokubacteria bacterium]
MIIRVLALAALVALAWSPVEGQAPKSGGSLNLWLREDLPQGFAIHETATISTVWPAMPCFNNLVLFDPLKRVESADTVIGELAERWSWQDGYRALVFFLRKDVTWHDGRPFTSRDVKATLDMLRESPDAPQRLRLNPRRGWYGNLEAVEAVDPHTVAVRLKRPQPSFLLMLASGYSPIYAAHVAPGSYRTGCVGTGPFKLKEWRKGEFVDYVKNPDYFVKGRPRLDSLRYLVIAERGTAMAAIRTGRVDVSFPGETTNALADQLRKAVPQIVLTPASTNFADNVIMNIKKPPFDNVKVRLAVSRAIDRRALIQAAYQGGAVVGASLLPRPWGVWGLLDRDLAALPGYGKPADEKAKARQLLAEAGFAPGTPLKVELLTRAIPAYVDVATFVLNELKLVGIEATLKTVETAQWHPLATRGDYQIGTNRTGIGLDDPDANFFENYGCGSPRNYSYYCNEEVAKLVEQQSRELDAGKRLTIVYAIQKKLEDDAARPILSWRVDSFARWPHVKNLLPHQSMYNWGRMQEVWVDR